MEVGGFGSVSNAAVTVESQVPLPTVTVNDASSEPQAFETLNRTRYDPSLEYSWVGGYRPEYVTPFPKFQDQLVIG